jgi:hypothetical protein
LPTCEIAITSPDFFMIPTCRARALARLVLVWFVLSMSLAAVSPQVMPRSVQWQEICSVGGAGMRMVGTDDGVQDAGGYHRDCPLCVSAGAPPPKLAVGKPPLLCSPGHRPRPAQPAHIADATAAPLPARGPPTIS